MSDALRPRRYPMRPYGSRNTICRAFDVPPGLITHTARPLARWVPMGGGYMQAVADIPGVGTWRFEMNPDSLIRFSATPAKETHDE